MATGLIGIETAEAIPRRSQVYRVTHIAPVNGSLAAEWPRESFMNRSFISFSYGGKWIEDFSLISTIENNRLQRNASAQFEDFTSRYEVFDGQFYWGTHFLNNELSLILATDGITQNQLDDFKHWFHGGVTRELVLAEHPNRAIMARVAMTPVISVLPFEEKTKVNIAGLEYDTSTTLYKGQIQLKFIMDEPFWYSKVNLFGNPDNESSRWVDVWSNASGETVDIFEDKDALKVVKEDGVPLLSMITNNILIGDDNFIDLDFTISGESTPETTIPYQSAQGTVVVYNDTAVAGASRPEDENNDSEAVGFVAGRVTAIVTTGVDLAANTPLYFYYPGTAPAYPNISFTFTPIIDDSTDYISSPRNRFSSPSVPYDTLSIESTTQRDFNYSIPGAYLGYNQAIEIFKNRGSSLSTTELRQLIRNNVTHKYARAWAIAVVDSLENNFTVANACTRMNYFLYDTDGISILPSTFSINCRMGECIGHVGYRKTDGVPPTTNEGFATWGVVDSTSEEDIGDIIRSDYLTITDRNYPNDRGQIVAWSDDTEVTKTYSHKIIHNTVNGLTAFKLTYKYMYY